MTGPSEAFMRIVELGIALQIAPLDQHDGCWEADVDEHWFIAVNGHPEPRLMRKDQNLPPVQPYTVYVEWNGFPAGILTYSDGCIAAGAAANEDTLIAALVAAKKRAADTSAEGQS